MLEFTLFRIPIRVEPIFWITLGLIGFLDNQRGPSDQLLLKIALFVMAGFISVLIHELGHALMIKKYKLPTQIVLSSFGGYATHPAGILSRSQSFLVTLAGPLLQLILGLAVYFSMPHLMLPDTLIWYFVRTLAGISVFWAILNCIPILPMDGGRMLEAALGPRRIKLTLTISTLVAVVCSIIGFMIGSILIGIFMAMFAFQNYQTLERFK